MKNNLYPEPVPFIHIPTNPEVADMKTRPFWFAYAVAAAACVGFMLLCWAIIEIGFWRMGI